ncbi:MAG TPA: PQQ-binding-like beta-propeller repeat protein [Ktedonobacterales bacterium]|nr:PQQ-binding-like beta-propeller repeat protein [Ktedonobacterales bacterium]
MASGSAEGVAAPHAQPGDRSMAAPVAADAIVYVGSGDVWVYALTA